MESSEGWGESLLRSLALPNPEGATYISCAVHGLRHRIQWPWGEPSSSFLPCTVDLSSWREKIARDVAGATWGNGSGEEEEEEDGPAVLVEQQTDSAMEPTGPIRERYKDGVVTIGCVGKEAAAMHGGLLGGTGFQCLEKREGGEVPLGSRVSEGRGGFLLSRKDHGTPELNSASQRIDLKQVIYPLSVLVTWI